MAVHSGRLPTVVSHCTKTWTFVAILACMSGETLAGTAGPSGSVSAPGQIAFIRDGNIWISDADGGGQRKLTSDGSGTYGQSYLSVTWLRGTRVVFLKATGRGLGRVGILDTASGRQSLVPGTEGSAAVGVYHKQNRIG